MLYILTHSYNIEHMPSVNVAVHGQFCLMGFRFGWNFLSRISFNDKMYIDILIVFQYCVTLDMCITQRMVIIFKT